MCERVCECVCEHGCERVCEYFAHHTRSRVDILAELLREEAPLPPPQPLHMLPVTTNPIVSTHGQYKTAHGQYRTQHGQYLPDMVSSDPIWSILTWPNMVSTDPRW